MDSAVSGARVADILNENNVATEALAINLQIEIETLGL